MGNDATQVMLLEASRALDAGDYGEAWHWYRAASLQLDFPAEDRARAEAYARRGYYRAAALKLRASIQARRPRDEK